MGWGAPSLPTMRSEGWEWAPATLLLAVLPSRLVFQDKWGCTWVLFWGSVPGPRNPCPDPVFPPVLGLLRLQAADCCGSSSSVNAAGFRVLLSLFLKLQHLVGILHRCDVCQFWKLLAVWYPFLGIWEVDFY